MTSILNFTKYVALFSLVFLGIIFLLNQTAFAQSPDERDEAKRNSVAPSVSLISPLKNIDSIEGLLVAILNIIIILMIPIIVFFIILAGFKYVTAQGNASQVEDATRALTYAIIGGVLILGAVAISQIIANVVQSF